MYVYTYMCTHIQGSDPPSHEIDADFYSCTKNGGNCIEAHNFVEVSILL